MREACGDISVINLNAPLHDRNGSFRVSELVSGHPFGAIVFDFARRVVQPWADFLFERGPVESTGFVMKHTAPITEEVDPVAAIPLLCDALATSAAESGVMSATRAINPRTWRNAPPNAWVGTPTASVEASGVCKPASKAVRGSSSAANSDASSVEQIRPTSCSIRQ